MRRWSGPTKHGLRLAALLLALGRPAAAEPRNTAAATELFQKGRAAMKEQDYATACAAFADSQRFDPKVGTLLNLADCEEHIDQLISARAHWQQAADLAHAGGDARESVARQRFTAVDPKVAKLSVRLAPTAPGSALVHRDDVELGPGSLGVALPADPGTHRIVVAADGYDDAVTTVTLGEGDVKEVVVTTGAKHPPPPPATPPPLAGAAPPPAPSTSVAKPIAVIIGLVGIAAGVSVGTYFGINARKANDASYANGACAGDNTCDPMGLTQRDDAVRDGNISTIAFIAGGALAVTGIVIYATAPSSHESGRSGNLVLSPGGFELRGGF